MEKLTSSMFTTLFLLAILRLSYEPTRYALAAAIIIAVSLIFHRAIDAYRDSFVTAEESETPEPLRSRPSQEVKAS